MKTRRGCKVYPLTEAQKLHFYCLKYCPKKQVLNIGSSLTIEIDLDWEVLRGSIKEAISRCEGMRIRFAHDKKEGKEYQYVVKEDHSEIGHFDFCGWKMEDAEAKMREWTELPFERYDSPMHRIVMIRLPNGFQGTYVCVDHMTMDAQSLILFYRDIIEIYSHKMFGDEVIAYPKAMTSYIKQLEKDLAYEAGSTSSQRDREFFEKLIGTSEPIFNSIYGPGLLEQQRKASGNPDQRAARTIPEDVSANITTFRLEPSERLLTFCEEHRISMTCLLLMGLRTYLQKQNGNEDVSLTTTIARRATLTEKRCGGTRIHCFPFRTIISRDKTFLEGMEIIRDTQNQYFRHASYSPTEYFNYRKKFYNLEDGLTYEPLALTYQPLAMKYEGPSLDKMGGIRYDTARYSNGVAGQPLYLTVSHRALDDGLDFCFEYQTGIVTPQKLEEVYYYLCRIIFRGVEDCSRTVGEIIDMV